MYSKTTTVHIPVLHLSVIQDVQVLTTFTWEHSGLSPLRSLSPPPWGTEPGAPGWDPARSSQSAPGNDQTRPSTINPINQQCYRVTSLSCMSSLFLSFLHFMYIYTFITVIALIINLMFSLLGIFVINIQVNHESARCLRSDTKPAIVQNRLWPLTWPRKYFLYAVAPWSSYISEVPCRSPQEGSGAEVSRLSSQYPTLEGR